MIDKLMRKYLIDFVPYKVNEDAADIILDANESPFDLADSVKKKLISYLEDKSGLNRYPDTSSKALREAIAEKYGLSPEQILIGSGSDQLISVLVNTFAEANDNVLVPYPSFEMYKITSMSAFANIIEYELDPENGYRYVPDQIIECIKKHKPKLIYICSPNNPTGNIMSNEDIRKIADDAENSIIVLDEAYAEFSDMSYIKELDKTDNVIVLRTFSKAYGLAGLRCGYSISSTKIAKCMLKAIPPYNIGSFSQKAALYVLDDEPYYEQKIKHIKDERERTTNHLKRYKQIRVYTSFANFVLIKVLDGTDLYSELIERGIRIRKFGGRRLLEDTYRITVGSREENDGFLDAAAAIFG